MNVQIGSFKVKDGTSLHFEYWQPEVTPIGLLVFVHGLGDHAGRYGPFVRYFLERGWTVALYDQRGHGKSEGPSVYAETFETLLEDLVEFIEKLKKDFPNLKNWFLIGHSMGGQLILNLSATRSHPFLGVVVSSPNIRASFPVSDRKRKILLWLEKYFPKLKARGLIKAKWLSHDRAVVEKAKKDPLMRLYATLRLGRVILENEEKLFSLVSMWKTPVLFLHGRGDSICDPQATMAFYQELPFQDKQIRLYGELYHELLNEEMKGRIFKDIEKWLKKHLSVAC